MVKRTCYSIPIQVNYKRLTEDELAKLMESMREGCQNSREKIINHNLNLVLKIIKRFKNQKYSQDDLFQVGSIGLIKAVEKFDESLGFKFSTYAVPLIVGEIKRYVRDNKAMKVSRSIQMNYFKITTFTEKFQQKFERSPRISDISIALDLDTEDIVLALGAAEVVSLSRPTGHDDGEKELTLEDKIKDNTNMIEEWIEGETLKDKISYLSEKEKTIITLRYYKEKTQVEIGKELGISQAHVSRIEKNAMLKLRKIM